MKELVDYSLGYYEKNYKTEGREYLTLYKRYSYADVCRLLNWEKSKVSTIFGYLYDENTRTLPIFVNYNKGESISASTKYEDKFVNFSLMSWISRSNRKMSSKNIAPILSQKKEETKIYLFVRKNNSSVKLSDGSTDGKNKDAFKDFYYLGRVNYVSDSAKEISMRNDKNEIVPAVNLMLKLENPVRDDIFDYIVNK